MSPQFSKQQPTHRRDFLFGALGFAFTSPLSAMTVSALKPSPRMPVLFLGHGSPMNAIEDNAYRRSWQALGQEFGEGKKYPTPQAILCVSAHWMTRGWWVTGQARPRTIHDFGGFPQALFDQQYPAPGAPAVAEALTRLPASQAPRPAPTVGVDANEWGFDHGSWSVLKPMFPNANIPTLQLSLDMTRPFADHFAMGQHLRQLRERGVLIVGSGNAVHNLRTFRMGATTPAYDWAIEFDRFVDGKVTSGDLAGLSSIDANASTAKLAHPTYEHYLPLLHAAGAVHSGEPLRQFNTEVVSGSISMRSMVWG